MNHRLATIMATVDGNGRMRGPARRLVGSRIAQQATVFTGASVVASVLSLVARAVIAKSVSTEAFGGFAFAVACLGFLTIFFEFGVYSAAARMAAASPVDRREIVGAALVLYVPIGVLFSVVALALTPLANRWLDAELNTPLAIAAAFGVAYPFVFAGQQLAKGVDRLHVASIGSVAFPLVFIGLLGLLAVLPGEELSAGGALVVRSVALIVAGVLVAVWLRPTFQRVRRMSAEILSQTRSYGFQIYLGCILGTGTYNMDVLLVGAWAPAEEVGYYALAIAIAGGAGLPVIALSTALFPRMAVEARIDRRWLVLSAVAGSGLAVAAYLVAEPFVDAVFSERYRDVVPLLVPLLAAQVVRGVTSVYNVHLAAHGRGRELRDAGLVLTVGNLALSFALIPHYGATGAAWASFAALCANLVAHVVFYRRALPGQLATGEA